MSCLTLENCASGTDSRMRQSAFDSPSFLAITAFSGERRASSACVQLRVQVRIADPLSASSTSTYQAPPGSGSRICAAMREHGVDAGARQQFEGASAGRRR